MLLTYSTSATSTCCVTQRQHCDFLIAGVVADELLVATKGRPPVVPLAERLEIVRQIRYVDEAIAETLPRKIDTWRRHPFDIVFKGDDWRDTPKGLALEREFAAVGVEVVYFPYTMHTSSTSLRRTPGTPEFRASGVGGVTGPALGVA